jgi:hypothetical protein
MEKRPSTMKPTLFAALLLLMLADAVPAQMPCAHDEADHVYSLMRIQADTEARKGEKP